MNSIGKYSASILLLAAATTVAAESLQYTIDGVADPLKANVLAHIEKVQMGRQARLAEQDFPDVVADAVRRAREALRPFGFYAPSVDGRIERRDEETLRLILTIDAGPPIRVAEAHILRRSYKRKSVTIRGSSTSATAQTFRTFIKHQI